MNNEAIQLIVFRRGGDLFVVPSVLSDTGFDSLHEIFAVRGRDDLAGALEAGEKFARAATAMPKKERSPQAREIGRSAVVEEMPILPVLAG